MVVSSEYASSGNNAQRLFRTEQKLAIELQVWERKVSQNPYPLLFAFSKKTDSAEEKDCSY